MARRTGPPERVGALVPSVLRDLGLDESARALGDDAPHAIWFRLAGSDGILAR